MKKLIITLLALLTATVGLHAADEALNLKMKDGTIHSFLLAEKPVITIADNQLVMTTTEATATYSLYEVKEYTFGAPTVIQGIAVSKAVSREGNTITFSKLGGKTAVKAYTLGGQPVNLTLHSGADGSVSVSLEALPTGTYIIKADNATLKITKR